MQPPYFCKRCDVYGKGDSCWMCGSQKVEYGLGTKMNRQGGVSASAHRFDPEKTTVMMGAKLIPIEEKSGAPNQGSSRVF